MIDRKDIVKGIREWLGENGISHFRKYKEDYGTVSPVLDVTAGFPHTVHFREGMIVRNKIRELTEHSWSAHEYDDKWAEIVEEAILEDYL